MKAIVTLLSPLAAVEEIMPLPKQTSFGKIRQVINSNFLAKYTWFWNLHLAIQPLKSTVL